MLQQDLVNLCTKQGKEVLISLLLQHYEIHRDDFKDYAEVN